MLHARGDLGAAGQAALAEALWSPEGADAADFARRFAPHTAALEAAGRRVALLTPRQLAGD